jgi:soluble lytic murein transglycosylase-like protein
VLLLTPQSGVIANDQTTAPKASDAPVLSNTLPKPLSDSDAVRYRRLFALQEKGLWRRADRVIRGIENPILLGQIMAQRYLHPTRYRSRYRELADWMKQYADHPQAKRIYKLALRRKPRRLAYPRRPVAPRPAAYTESGNGGYERVNRRGVRYSRGARRVHARIKSLVRHQRLTVAEKYLSGKKARRLPAVHHDIARARIAAGWFFYGNDKKAYALAAKAAKNSGIHVPYAHWYAGLAAYRLGRYQDAARQFEAMAAMDFLPDWNRAAAAFWAARANMVAGNPENFSHWLRQAASSPRTFYGQLARRMLGVDSPFDWKNPLVEQVSVRNALKSPRAQRALALLQIGQVDLAERELRALAVRADTDERRALIAIADQTGLPALALRTAAALVSQNGQRVERGLYPVPGWVPQNGFTVDRALIYAVMRQESGFNSRAKSSAGARGLMQLMPATAGYMAKRRFRGRSRNQLYDPALNMSLGQKYLRYLIEHRAVGSNLFHMAAAYNGGPGNLAKWKRQVLRRTKDPLLFIESIPSRETRDFIERVLANLWMYRERLNQTAPTLESLAAGGAPIYKPQDQTQMATNDDGRN